MLSMTIQKWIGMDSTRTAETMANLSEVARAYTEVNETKCFKTIASVYRKLMRKSKDRADVVSILEFIYTVPLYGSKLPDLVALMAALHRKEGAYSALTNDTLSLELYVKCLSQQRVVFVEDTSFTVVLSLLKTGRKNPSLLADVLASLNSQSDAVVALVTGHYTRCWKVPGISTGKIVQIIASFRSDKPEFCQHVIATMCMSNDAEFMADCLKDMRMPDLTGRMAIHALSSSRRSSPTTQKQRLSASKCWVTSDPSMGHSLAQWPCSSWTGTV